MGISNSGCSRSLCYRGVPNLSPLWGAKIWHLTRVPIVSESLKTTPLRGGLNFGTIWYNTIK